MAIENGKCFVVHEGVFNIRNDQFIHTGLLGSDNVKVGIVDPVDMDALQPIPHEKITTISDAIDGFFSWPKKLVTLDARLLN